MRKEFKSILLIGLVLLFSSSFTVIKANAYMQTFYTDGPQREGTLPPEITIQSPTNNTYYNTNTILLSFNASVGNSTTANAKLIETIFYQPDWQSNSTYLYDRVVGLPMPPIITEFSTSINLTDVPDGNHSLTIYANERGDYFDRTKFPLDNYYTVFEINNTLTVNFVVDTVLPEISVLSPKNMAYPDHDVNLSCVFSEEVRKTRYSIDGLENVTFNEDKMLFDLSDGSHQLIVYSEDLAGNIGVSEIISFSIEPFPIIQVLGLVIIIIVGVGIFVYFKRRRS